MLNKSFEEATPISSPGINSNDYPPLLPVPMITQLSFLRFLVSLAITTWLRCFALKIKKGGRIHPMELIAAFNVIRSQSLGWSPSGLTSLSDAFTTLKDPSAPIRKPVSSKV
jgi:hypothetical protein